MNCKNVRFSFWLLLCLSVSLLTAPVHAAGTKRLALIIGNNAYSTVGKLENAVNDAKLMSSTLKKAGFEVTEVTNVDRKSMWQNIDKFKSRIGKGDDVVFYFAGHGVQIASNQILLPIDIASSNDEQVQRDGVSLVDVQDALHNAKFALLIIDACRNNPFPKNGTRSIGGGARGLTPPEPSTGQVIVMSAGRNQTAMDSVPGGAQKNGLFTSVLAEGIQTPGMEIRDVLERVKNTVDDLAKAAAHEQRPGLVSDMRGEFFFFGSKTSTPAKVVVAADPESETWGIAQRVDSVEAYRAYLAAYPSGRFVAAANIKIAALKPVVKKPAKTPVEAKRVTRNGISGSYWYIPANRQLMAWAPGGWKVSVSDTNALKFETDGSVGVGFTSIPSHSANNVMDRTFANLRKTFTDLKILESPKLDTYNGIRVSHRLGTGTDPKSGAETQWRITLHAPAAGEYLLSVAVWPTDLDDQYHAVVNSILRSVQVAP